MNTMTPHTGPIEERLRDAATVDPQQWRRITATLAQRAESEDLVDVAFERHDSPLGSIIVAASREGLVRVGLPAEGEDAVLDELARRISGRVLLAPRPAVTRTRSQLDEYFDKHRTQFDVELDWRLTGGFRRQVLSATAQIPYGKTVSYTDVAA